MTTGPDDVVAGRYRLRSQIGGGAMGAVWLAHDERLGRDVALKQVLLPPGQSAAHAEENRQLAMREARIAARLQHPHAVVVYDTVVAEGQPWLVMEYLPSRSLAEVVAAAGVLPVEQTAQVGAQVADALSAAHAAGIVHRDVKPGNILIGEGPGADGLVKITDFGIARARGDVRLTQTGIVKGTPAFLAPEVARGEEPGSASDVFSLGATLYACLEGQPPFGVAENSLKMLYRAAAGDIYPPERSGALTKPLLRMLSGDPEQRPTMVEVRDELIAVARDDGDATAVLTTPAVLSPVPPSAVRATTARSAAPRQQPAAAPGATGRPPERTATRTDLPAGSPPRGPAPSVAPATPRPAPALRRWPLLVAGLLLLALVGAGIALVVSTLGDGEAGSSAASSSASTSAQEPAPAPAPAPEPTAPSTTPSPPASTIASTTAAPAPTTPGAEVTAKDLQKELEEYYKLLPGNADEAYDRTGPTLRARLDRESYRGFWSGFEKVELGEVQATDGSLVVTAPVTFVRRGGEEVREQHQITFVRGPEGQLLVDVDVPV
ncbi:serine/threonine-protein kinase [Goekera deserti]|uniref:serine/threonine-protein kinase n=1 Tax=Goekera deserti TaxID=2497753 RepID=UPI00192E9F24|nr:serine/threonine-protein kinase [Goekera deserti]